MSVREEDRQKNSCPSRGLGIAAAAIGVGVGAALYYFFSKRPENPSTEGSSSNWNCERQQTFRPSESDDSYTTVSEHETSDTSINRTAESVIIYDIEASLSAEHSTADEDSHTDTNDEVDDDDDDDDVDVNSESDADSDLDAAIIMSLDMYRDSSFEITSPRSSEPEASDSESDHREWDITATSSGVPTDMSWLNILQGGVAERVRRNRKAHNELMAIRRQEAFRERSWTLEECSICFDVMLRNQDVTSLPCAHNFHTDCIMPWLQEKQTCPNCRKVAE
ncbi:hypothetical protein PYW07_013391 [Mythimna separata]|uniref:RING-type E3 ubiquitin transferase n=1 Tax=Mythimna separata TaxID=271217 RepID=A0AAD7Y6L0_MYTSE|nr:hypothetical protein PYW07_013391 [Mythimna separata]